MHHVIQGGWHLLPSAINSFLWLHWQVLLGWVRLWLTGVAYGFYLMSTGLRILGGWVRGRMYSSCDRMGWPEGQSDVELIIIDGDSCFEHLDYTHRCLK
jgi:hypothetical protein